MAKDRQSSVQAWVDRVQLDLCRLLYSLQLMLVWLWWLQQAMTTMMHVRILQHLHRLLLQWEQRLPLMEGLRTATMAHAWIFLHLGLKSLPRGLTQTVLLQP
jgi:hypothetical protein